jgi:hypothetical protein
MKQKGFSTLGVIIAIVVVSLAGYYTYTVLFPNAKTIRIQTIPKSQIEQEEIVDAGNSGDKVMLVEDNIDKLLGRKVKDITESSFEDTITYVKNKEIIKHDLSTGTISKIDIGDKNLLYFSPQGTYYYATRAELEGDSSRCYAQVGNVTNGSSYAWDYEGGCNTSPLWLNDDIVLIGPSISGVFDLIDLENMRGMGPVPRDGKTTLPYMLPEGDSLSSNNRYFVYQVDKNDGIMPDPSYINTIGFLDLENKEQPFVLELEPSELRGETFYCWDDNIAYYTSTEYKVAGNRPGEVTAMAFSAFSYDPSSGTRDEICSEDDDLNCHDHLTELCGDVPEKTTDIFGDQVMNRYISEIASRVYDVKTVGLFQPKHESKDLYLLQGENSLNDVDHVWLFDGSDDQLYYVAEGEKPQWFLPTE